jgi:hypothetical protein
MLEYGDSGAVSAKSDVSDWHPPTDSVDRRCLAILVAPRCNNERKRRVRENPLAKKNTSAKSPVIVLISRWLMNPSTTEANPAVSAAFAGEQGSMTT